MQSGTSQSQSSVRYEGGASVLPVEGSDAGEILINDHEAIKPLLQSLCDAQERAQRVSILDRLKAMLTIHNATEENLVYPALQEVAGKKHESQHLYKETAEAAVLLFTLDTMLKTGEDAEFAQSAKAFQAALLEHIEDEETKMIPELREKATPDQAQLLTRSVREFRSGIQVNAG